MPALRYAARGVAATETMPQPSSRRNFSRSGAVQTVCDVANAIIASAVTGMAPT